jgi:tetratricopeptide (TPR) repeat protein
MVRRYGWPLWLLIVVVGTALAVAPSAAAQTSGTVRGQVVDANGQPVEGATVTITGEATGRKYQSRTNRRGEFIQIGLTVGPYVLIAEKDKQASEQAKATVRNAAPATVNLMLGAGASAAASAAASKESATFSEGVALSTAGKHAEAIEKFNAGIATNPGCFECYNNIGYSYSQMKEYDKAEAAYKKAAELKPDNATAWNGLANIYNAQRKFDLAVEASKKATDLSGAGGASAGGGGGNADAMYNQGVILWNGGKVADAKKQFEAAIQANPSHAEAHYQLGMALVNEGNLAGAGSEFETYLKLAPDGPNAATAKSLVAQLKK